MCDGVWMRECRCGKVREGRQGCNTDLLPWWFEGLPHHTTSQALKPKSRSVLLLYKQIVKAGSERAQSSLNEHEMQQI